VPSCVQCPTILPPLAQSTVRLNNLAVQEAAVGLVFAATLISLYYRPFGARDWQVATAGAALAFAVSPLSASAAREVLRESGTIVAFFLGLMLLSAAAEAAGLYRQAAGVLGRRRSQRTLLAAVLAFGAVITAILSNDATPLVLTPAVFLALRGQGPAAPPAAFGVAFVANGASLLLPFSNPVNLLFYERFDLGPGDWLREVLPAALAGLAALSAVLLWRARHETPAAPKHPLEPLRAPTAPRAFRWSAWAVFGLLVAAYGAAALADIALGLVALSAGAVLLCASLTTGASTLREYRRHVSVGMLVFIAALLVLVESVAEAGLLGWLADTLGWLDDRPALVSVLGAALLAATLSNVMNNWPAAVLLATAIGATNDGHTAVLVGSLVGLTIGANFTMVGSLSNVFWLTLARQHGAGISAATFARRAFAPTALALLAASAVAALTA
jgi:arsenical pump membrane protein